MPRVDVLTLLWAKLERWLWTRISEMQPVLQSHTCVFCVDKLYPITSGCPESYYNVADYGLTCVTIPVRELLKETMWFSILVSDAKLIY